MIGVIGAELVEAFFWKKGKHVAEGLLNILRLVRLEMSSGSGCLSSAGSCQSSPPHLWSSATKWLRSQSNVLGRWWCRTLGRRRADWEGQASRIYSKCYPFFGRSSQNHAVLEVKLVLEGKHGETIVLQLCFGWFWWVYREAYLPSFLLFTIRKLRFWCTEEFRTSFRRLCWAF